MLSLDIRTIFTVTGLMACLLSLIICFQRHSYPASINGMGEWALAPLAGFVATVMLRLRGVLPDILSVGVGNVMLFLGAGVMLSGTVRFFGQSLHRHYFFALALLSLFSVWWLSSSMGHYADRIVFVCVVMSVLSVWHAWVIGRELQQSFATRFTVAVLLLHTAILLTRAATVFDEPGLVELYSNSPLQVAYLASFSFCLLLEMIGLVLMASERVRKELQQLLRQDSLTGVLTRRALFEDGESEILRSRRNGSCLSVLMLDLDGFKAINDRFGHHTGDLILTDFARRASLMLRRPSQLGRYGGEEFAALLPDTGLCEAQLVAERILASVTTDPRLPACTVSIGIATCLPQSGETLTSLLNRADEGLYRAKAQGRNRVEFGIAPPLASHSSV